MQLYCRPMVVQRIGEKLCDWQLIKELRMFRLIIVAYKEVQRGGKRIFWKIHFDSISSPLKIESCLLICEHCRGNLYVSRVSYRMTTGKSPTPRNPAPFLLKSWQQIKFIVYPQVANFYWKVLHFLMIRCKYIVDQLNEVLLVRYVPPHYRCLQERSAVRWKAHHWNAIWS